jgi:DNA-binding GntR family transcriptional regulator
MLDNSYLDKQSFASQIYEFIKKEIYDQRLMPLEKVNISQLAQKLNCSIVPVREALSRLHAEKLLDLAPYRGYVVTALLDAPSFLNLFEVRKLLELKAIELAVHKISDYDLNKMKEVIKQGEIILGDRFSYEDFKPFTESDYAFHHFIFEIAGNNFLLESWMSLRVHLHLSRLYFLKGSVYTEPGSNDHWKIFSALEKRNLKDALAAMEKHLSGACERLIPTSN